MQHPESDHLFRARAAAGIVDTLFVAVMLPLVYSQRLWEAMAAGVVLTIINPLFFAFTISQYGATPGKRLFWLRVADKDRRLPGFGRALLRVALKPPFVAAVGGFIFEGLAPLFAGPVDEMDVGGFPVLTGASLIFVAIWAIGQIAWLFYCFGSFVFWNGQAYWDRIAGLYVYDVGDESIAAR